MNAREPLTWPTVTRIATDVGLDAARLQRDMQVPAIREAIDRNRALARSLGIEGTPAFVVGNELKLGLTDRARLEGLVTRARGR